MFSYTDTIENIKKFVIDTVQNINPTQIYIAKVIKINPIELELIDTKIKIYSNQIYLSKNVMQYKVSLQYSHNTSIAGSHNHLAVAEPTTVNVTVLENGEHNHEIKGISNFIIYQGLQINDLVIVLQLQGAEKYYILDKVYKNDNYEPATNL